MNILLINFSNRDFGNCGSITNFIKDNSKDEIKIKSFASLNISPCGDCNCECFNERLNCPFIRDDTYELYEDICKSDLVYFIVPNYCDYPCSNFFKFNERGLCYFSGMSSLLEKYESIIKRYIVISNTEKENFIQAFKYHSINLPKILFLSAKFFNKRSIDGDLLESEVARNEILNFIGDK